MSISSYSNKLLHNLKKSPDKFIDYYFDEQQAIFDELKKNAGLKTDISYKRDAYPQDLVRFSVVFSDVTSLNLGIGKGGQVFIGNPNHPSKTLRITFPFAITEELEKIIHGGEVAVGYLVPTNEELLSILNELEPFVDAGRIILQPERVIIYPEGERKEGEGRRWKTFSIDPNSPIHNWLVISESLKQNSLPIQSNKEISKYENPIFDISFPYLDGINFQTLAKIINDENDHLAELRGAIKKAVSEVPNNKDLVSEISNDVIKPEISKINRRFKSITQTHSLRIAGAFVSTAGISLVALSAEGWIAAAASLLGASGLGLITKEFSEYIKSKDEIKDNPYYLFWRLKSAHKGDKK